MTDFDFIHDWHAWIGKRVCVKNINHGILRYFGEISAQDGKWCGIELDESLGENDGAILGERYFTCSANHGVFVPATDVTRIQCKNNESFPKDFKENSDSKIPLFKPVIMLTENQEKTQFDGDYHLVTTAGSNKNGTFISEEDSEKTHANHILSDKLVDFSTMRSDGILRNSCKSSVSDHLDSEESLGIIPDILNCSSPCDLLCLNSNDFLSMEQNSKYAFQFPQIDVLPEVFSPSNSKYCHLVSQAECTDSPLQNGLDAAKYTSTPKQIIKNHFNLDTTITLQQKQYSDFLLQDAKLEPVIAGSGHTTEVNFCNDNFGSDHILCSTSKISSLLLTDIVFSDEKVESPNNDLSLTPKNTSTTFTQDNLNTTQILSNKQIKTKTKLNNHKENTLHHVDILNATFEVKSVSYDDEVTSSRNNYRPFGSASNVNIIKEDLIKNSDSGSETCDITIQNLSGEKTFIIDCSPVKNISAKKSKNMAERGSLNITYKSELKNNICQSLQINSSINQKNRIASNMSKKSIVPDKTEYRKSISLPVNSCGSFLQNTITKNKAFNTTFCIENVDERSKRHSTPTYFTQNCPQSAVSNTKSDGTEGLNVFKKPFPVGEKFKKSELKKDPYSISKAMDVNHHKSKSCIKKSSQSSVIPKSTVTQIIPKEKKNQIPVSAPLEHYPQTISKIKSRTLLPQMINKLKTDGKNKSYSTCRSSNDALVRAETPQFELGNKETNLTKVNKLVKGSVQTNVLKKSLQNVSNRVTQDDKENFVVQKYTLSKFPTKGIKTQKLVKEEEIEIPSHSVEFQPDVMVNTVKRNEIPRNTSNLQGKVQIEKNAEYSAQYEFNSVQNNKSSSITNKLSKNIPKVSLSYSNKTNADMEYSVKEIASNTVKNKTRHSLLPSLKPLGSKSGISNINKIPNVHKSMYAGKQVENVIQELSISDDECISKSSQQSQFPIASTSDNRKENGLHNVVLPKEKVKQKFLPSTSDSDKKLSATYSVNRILMPVTGKVENGSQVPILKSNTDSTALQSYHGSLTKTSQHKFSSRKLPDHRLNPSRSHLPTPSHIKKFS